jgi:hypothetical protein
MKRGVSSSLFQSKIGPMAQRDENHLESSAGVEALPSDQAAPFWQTAQRQAFAALGA